MAIFRAAPRGRRRRRLSVQRRFFCCYNVAAMKPLPIIACTALLMSPVLAAEQQGVVVREAPVHAEASSGSKRVGNLKAGKTVDVIARQGGWKQIGAEDLGVVGWIRSYQVREGDLATTSTVETSSDSRGFLDGLASFSRKASRFFRGESSHTSEGTATIGVRGLSEQEIRGAQADFEQLEKLEQFASDNKRARNFASKGGLKSIKVPYLSGSEE